MTISASMHIVVYPMPMWGHSRTMCTLVARLVKLRNVNVTFFTVSRVYEQVKLEISREFLPGEDFASKIRVITLEDDGNEFDVSVAEASFAANWPKILNRQALTCSKTGALFEPPASLPSAAILDIFVNKAFNCVRKLSPTIKVLTWYPASTIALPVYNIDHQATAIAESQRRNIPFETVALEFLSGQSGKIIRTPCTPPMHDYEYHPQQFPFSPNFAANVAIKMPEIIRRTDGLVTFDAADFCPEATQTIKALMAENGKKAYYAGPLIPRMQEDTTKDPRGATVLKFLNEKLQSHGEKSLIYISFGSLFWPMDTSKLWAVIDVVMEQNIPFVMSAMAALSSKPPPDVADRIAKYRHGIVVEWAPQQALLDHPVTGLYLTHGGHNSTLETIIAGVPAIVWPIDADQPLNAIHLTESLDVAYELVEVRHGTGAGRIFRNGRSIVGTVDAVKYEMRGVIESAFGPDGARKRAKLQLMRRMLQRAWSENGVARREVEQMLDDIRLA